MVFAFSYLYCVDFPDFTRQKINLDDMFSLEMNAKIAANFVLRGYCPLLGKDAISLMSDEEGKEAVVRQIIETRRLLENLPEIRRLDDSKVLADKAGFSEIQLCQSDL